MRPSSTSSSEGDDVALRNASTRGALTSALVMLAVFVGGDVAFRASLLGRGLARESWYIVRPQVFTADEGRVDILGLGDSRMGNAFNPTVIQRFVEAERGETVRVWNGALPGAPPMAHLAWIQRLLSKNPHPRMVVLSISPYMFSSRVSRAPSRESLSTIYRAQDIPSALRAGASPEDLFTIWQSDMFLSQRVRPRLIEVLTKFSGVHDGASVGVQGFEEHPAVDRPQQEARARGRVGAYQHELNRAEVTFGNEQQGYFVESLRTLRAHGVTAVVLDSLCASQMDTLLGPDGIYPEHIAWVRAQARAYGAVFVDAKHPPSNDDGDFSDVDHVSTAGSVRFTTWLAHNHLVPALGGARRDRVAACRAVFDFEDPAMPGWSRTGDASGDAVVAAPRRNQQPVVGFTGVRYLTTFTEELGDRATAELTSPPFALDAPTLRVRVGGGTDGGLGVEVLVNGAVVATARGRDAETLYDAAVDVRAWQGQQATLRVRDAAYGGWGHLQVDDVALCPE